MRSAVAALIVLAGCAPAAPKVVTVVHTRVITRQLDVPVRIPARMLMLPARPRLPLSLSAPSMGAYLGRLTSSVAECRAELLWIRKHSRH